jgi:ADP-ribosylglycohydrolase
MAQSFNICENAMLGHALANNFQMPTYMALSLGKSLQKLGKFDQADVMSYYLHLCHISQCDIGEVTKLVYEELKASLTTKSDTLTRNHFKFSVDQIQHASRSAHDKLKGLSSGCNPAQRSFPLAFCPWITDEQLFKTACDEASLTHFSATAGQVSGLVNLICRRLLQSDDWDTAVKTAFLTAPNLLGEIREIRSRYEHDTVLNTHGHPAYAPNTLNTSLYCVTNADSFENALQRASEIDNKYCPTLVGLLAGARWGVPKSILDNCHHGKVNEIRQIAKCFTDEWNKPPALKNDSKKTTLSFTKWFS